MFNSLSISFDNYFFLPSLWWVLKTCRYSSCELSRWFKVCHLFEEMCSYAFYLFFCQNIDSKTRYSENICSILFSPLLYFLFISVSFSGLRITSIFWNLEICSNPCSVLTRKSLNTITDEKKSCLFGQRFC